jgi:gluconolactonase
MRAGCLLFSMMLLLSLASGCGQSDDAASDSEASETPANLLIESESPEIISGGHSFTEGPYWHPEGYLLFSDIPANRVYKWVEGEETQVYMEPSGNSNGIAADTDGSILLAQHRGSVARVSADGSGYEIIAGSYEGLRFNSPNDLDVRSDGIIYFTDPPFGVSPEDRELDFSGVYMLTPDGTLSLVYDAFDYPNGITFNAEETILYVNDSATGDIKAFEIDDNGLPQNPRTFANIGAMGSGKGAADGMITDIYGNLYTTGPRGLTIFNKDGEQQHLIPFEEQITNLEWGGADASQLFITGANNVYRFQMNTTGL